MGMDMLAQEMDAGSSASKVTDPLSGSRFDETQEEDILGPAAMAIQGLQTRASRVRRLKQSQKAAVIVRLLLSQGLAPSIDRLPPDQQEALALTMSSLGPVNRDTLYAVIREFAEALDDLALTFPSALPDAVQMLEQHLSPNAAENLKSKAAAGDGSDPWPILAAMPSERLAPLLAHESAEVCAILLSKIGVAKAAEILAGLPEDRAPQVAHAISLTATVTPIMVEKIGKALLKQMQSQPRSVFKASAVERVGAMLNAARGSAREAILKGLMARDAAFGEEVKRAIFTFEHIPRRLDAKDVAKVMRKVDGETMLTALAAGLKSCPAVVEFLLGNMSKRLAEQIREDANARETPRLEEGEAAMNTVIAAIRDLEEAGELRLIPPEE